MLTKEFNDKSIRNLVPIQILLYKMYNYIYINTILILYD